MDFESKLITFLEKNEILSLATFDGKHPYVCNLHYSSDDYFNLYFASKPDRKHSQNIENHSDVAVCIYDPTNSDNALLSGIQMKGTCIHCKIEDHHSEITKFYRKFPGKFADEAKEILTNLEFRTFYKFIPKWIRLIDGHSWEYPHEVTLPTPRNQN